MAGIRIAAVGLVALVFLTPACSVRSSAPERPSKRPLDQRARVEVARTLLPDALESYGRSWQETDSVEVAFVWPTAASESDHLLPARISQDATSVLGSATRRDRPEQGISEYRALVKVDRKLIGAFYFRAGPSQDASIVAPGRYENPRRDVDGKLFEHEQLLWQHFEGRPDSWNTVSWNGLVVMDVATRGGREAGVILTYDSLMHEPPRFEGFEPGRVYTGDQLLRLLPK